MKKHCPLPVLLLTVLVCLSAVFLPERLAVRQDRELLKLAYSEDVSDADVQIVFDLTTAQRLNILVQASVENDPLSSYIGKYDFQPDANEIQEEQCIQACLEELDTLAKLNQSAPISERFNISDCYFQHYGILNWDNPQEKLLLWNISLSFSSDDAEYFGLSCLMDAETGALYYFNLSGNYIPEFFDSDTFPDVFADYLGMELSDSQTNADRTEVPSSYITHFVLSQDEYSFQFELGRSSITDLEPGSNLEYYYIWLYPSAL